MKLKKIILNKSRKADVFGMSFGMIFSIILIAFFLVVAIIGVKYILSWQRQSQIGLFLRDLQNEVNDAWNSEKTSFVFKSSLPSGIDDVCFVSFDVNPKGYSNYELNLYDKIKKGNYDASKNTYLMSSEENYPVHISNIKNIELTKKNPICVKVIDGKISIKIDKKAESALVFLSA